MGFFLGNCPTVLEWLCHATFYKPRLKGLVPAFLHRQDCRLSILMDLEQVYRDLFMSSALYAAVVLVLSHILVLS